MPRGLAVLAVVVAATGCADPPAVQGCGDPPPIADERGWRLQGRLDRDLTDAECTEFRDVTGQAPQMVSTDVGCGPQVDPYDCNHVSASAAGFSAAECERARDRLESRSYWRGPPSCVELPD